jgi:hypothetical protein
MGTETTLTDTLSLAMVLTIQVSFLRAFQAVKPLRKSVKNEAVSLLS